MSEISYNGINEALEDENQLKDGIRFLEQNNEKGTYDTSIGVLEVKLSEVKTWLDARLEEASEG